jgi:hypothetical protein
MFIRGSGVAGGRLFPGLAQGQGLKKWGINMKYPVLEDMVVNE